MVWKTTNCWGKEVTWYSEEEVKERLQTAIEIAVRVTLSLKQSIDNTSKTKEIYDELQKMQRENNQER